MLADNIKRLRRKRGWSQEKLSREAGITYSTLIKIESGVNKNHTLTNIKKIAGVFKVSIDKLVGTSGVELTKEK